jgi:hypothetical protein
MSREITLPAVHATPIARWRSAISRVMFCAATVGLLMSLVGAFALDDDPVGIRTLYLVGINLIGAAVEMVAYRIAWWFSWTRGRYWHRVLLATVLVVVPVGLLIWASAWLFGRNLPMSALLRPVRRRGTGRLARLVRALLLPDRFRNLRQVADLIPSSALRKRVDELLDDQESHVAALREQQRFAAAA